MTVPNDVRSRGIVATSVSVQPGRGFSAVRVWFRRSRGADFTPRRRLVRSRRSVPKTRRWSQCEAISMNGASRPRSSKPHALDAVLADPDLRIVDCTTWLMPAGPDDDAPYRVVPGRAEYDAGHVPGAVFLDIQGDILGSGHPAPVHGARPRTGSRTRWDDSGSGTEPGGALTPMAASCGRPGCGGCCEGSDSTGPRCSTAASRSGSPEGRPPVHRAGRLPPPARFDARPRPGSLRGPRLRARPAR